MGGVPDIGGTYISLWGYTWGSGEERLRNERQARTSATVTALLSPGAAEAARRVLWWQARERGQGCARVSVH